MGLNENSTAAEFAKAVNDFRADADQIWVLIAGFLVFFMHAGFTMLEAGSVRHKNAVNILFKNMGTIAIGGICYYISGFAFAYGESNSDSGAFKFIGSGNYFLADITSRTRHSFFFQFAFAATAATIVSGAVAGRIQLAGYFCTAAWLTIFVYPVVSHWIWATGGWLSAFTDQADVIFGPEGCGMLDYAGSGVVHLTGGVAAFWGALILGPRIGRYDADGSAVDIPAHNISFQALGTWILWFGWYGFNVGSTLAFDGQNAAKVAVTTTLSPCAAVLVGMILSRVLKGHFDIGVALNCALAGLVSITAGCSTVPDWAALICGAVGAVVYFFSSKLMVKIKVDDPVDAVAVHGWCGIWGCIATGLFATEDNIFAAYSERICTAGAGLQIGTQIVGVFSIIAWVSALTVPLFIILKIVGLLRVSVEMEETGLDLSEHGGTSAYVHDSKLASVNPEYA